LVGTIRLPTSRASNFRKFLGTVRLRHCPKEVWQPNNRAKTRDTVTYRTVSLQLRENSAMAVYKRGEVYWYSFIFAGQRVQESSKSHSKTVAREAERQRRRELEAAINGLKPVREERIRTIKDIWAE
jgi:hypothetical protein